MSATILPMNMASRRKRVLVHGTIDHGTQLLSDTKGRTVTSYFGVTSGINLGNSNFARSAWGAALGYFGSGARASPPHSQMKVTRCDYYEINPLVLDIASHQFGFLKGCPTPPQVYMGDARLVLEDMAQRKSRLSGDGRVLKRRSARPLLTKEAYKIYLRHLKPNGILAVHISNRYLDLKPVVAQGMKEIGWHGRVIEDDGADEPYYTGTHLDDSFARRLVFQQ